MDQKRDLEQSKVSGKLFLVGFLVLIAVIFGLLYLNPDEGSVFKGKEVEFEGLTGADVVTGADTANPEICKDNINNDADTLIDCKDYQECVKNAVCSAIGTSKKCVWSYIGNADQSSPPSSNYQISCCNSNQCYWSYDGCLNYEQASSSYYYLICGSGNNLDSCGEEGDTDTFANKHPGDLSDGGGHQCVFDNGIYRWKPVCNLNNKYKLEECSTGITSGENCYEICDGSRWRQCENDLDRTPIYDPNIIITCQSNDAITTNEYNCNNDVDDDRDGLIDGADSPDCTGTLLTYTLDTKRYEVIVKTDDNFGFWLKT